MLKKELFCCLAAILISISFIGNACGEPNQIDYAVSFQADKRDSDGCRDVKVVNDKWEFPEYMTNPAMTCPDAWSWKVFLEAISSEFWINWAYDSYSFPEKPMPLCTTGQKDKSSCCDPDSESNPGYNNTDNPAVNCPYYPGDHDNSSGNRVTAKVSTSHASSMVAMAGGPDPGRVIRQEDAEMVFRNKPMWNYIFDNNLYNEEGLGELYKRADSMVKNDSPYINGAGFAKDLNITGYNKAPTGPPSPDWFYNPGPVKTYQGVQVDYMWGILFANPIGGSVE